MMRPVFWCLVFCVAGMALADSPSPQRQGPTPPVPPPPASQNTPAPKIEKKPVALTPLEEAEQLYRMGKFNEAVERYNATKAVERDPSLGTAHSALGEVHFRQGKIHEAETDFLSALKLDQMDARSYLDLARVYQATYDFKKAKVAIDKAHSLDPTDPEIGSAWVETRARSEQLKALEDEIASLGSFYSRAAKAGFKHQLAIMRDEIEHPERTCGLVSPPEGAEIPLTPMAPLGPKSDNVGLQVQVNGVGSQLVLSTVSSGIVINGTIAQAAGVHPVTRTDIDALGEQNPPEVYIGFARSLKIENLEFQNCYVTVIEKAAPGSFYDQFEGLIAAGFFSTYLVDVDMPHGQLKLQPLPSRPATEDPDSAAMDSSDPDAKNFHDRYISPKMTEWTPMYHFGNAIVIPARVNDSPPELFEVAASSKYNVLAPEFARERASLKRELMSAHLEGINGRVGAESTGKVKLELAGLHFKAIRVFSFDDTRASDNAETEISGYLGLDLLRNLHFIIDYRDGLIHFDNVQRPR